MLVALYSLLGILILAVEARQMRRRGNALTFFNGAYFIFFVFVPLNVLILGDDAVRQKYAYQRWGHGDISTALTLIFSYLSFVFGFFQKNWRRARLCVGEASYISVAWLIRCFFVLGAIALIYHVTLADGVIDALRLAPSIRTGEYRLEGRTLFVRQFAYFVATAFMLTWAVYIDVLASNPDVPGRSPRLNYYRWLLLLTGLAFVYYALSTYGRREFLYPMIVCFVIWGLAGSRRWWGGLGWLMSLSVLWFVAYSFVIPSAARSVAAQSAAFFLNEAYFKIIQGLGDSFMHLVAAQHAELWQFGFLADLGEIPLQFLPSQALGFERPRGMFGETSEFILGRPLEPGLSGEEPLGLHGYLLVNFSYIGMFIVFYLMGVGYRALDAVLRPPEGGSAVSWLIFVWAIIGVLEFLRDGVLILVLKPRFSWWLTTGILLWSGYRHAVREASSFQPSRQSTRP